MSLGLVGRKIGMTRIFSDDGSSLPVTVLEVANNYLAQLKTIEVDGYNAAQIAYGVRRPALLAKSMVGHLAKAGIKTVVVSKEYQLADLDGLKLGQVISADIFSIGQKIDVTATSKGKGFAGVIRRHNFSSNRASHGNSVSHNKPGSIGMAQDPGRVFPGKKLPGQYGSVTRTIQNLDIVRIDSERQLIFVRGSVPGADGAIVYIKSAVKAAVVR